MPGDVLPQQLRLLLLVVSGIDRVHPYPHLPVLVDSYHILLHCDESVTSVNFAEPPQALQQGVVVVLVGQAQTRQLAPYRLHQYAT